MVKPVAVELSEVYDLLVEDLHEKSQRRAMRAKFEQLQSSADIVNFLDPEKSHRPRTDSKVQLTSGHEPVSSPRSRN